MLRPCLGTASWVAVKAVAAKVAAVRAAAKVVAARAVARVAVARVAVREEPWQLLMESRARERQRRLEAVVTASC